MPGPPRSSRWRVRPAPRGAVSCSVWRWRWDLNPRWSYPHTRFRGVLLRPLGHATAGGPTGACRAAKKSTSRAARLLRRAPRRRPPRCAFASGSRVRSHTEPHAPALGSHAPNTIRCTRAAHRRPAHMTHGSSVTTRVQPSSRQDPGACGRRAERDHLRVAGRVRPAPRARCARAPMTSPAGSTTTAPTGTSWDRPLAAATASASPSRAAYDCSSRRIDRCAVTR